MSRIAFDGVPRYRPGRRLATIVLTAAVIAGCSGGDDTANPGSMDSTTTSSTSTSSTTTTAPPATTSTLPLPDGDDPQIAAVIAAFYTADWYITASNPDPPRVSEYISPKCDCYKGKVDTAQGFVAAGQHVEGEPTVPVRFKVTEPYDPETRFMSAVVEYEVRPRRLVDSTGNLVQDIPVPTTPPFVSLSFQKEADADRWLLVNTFPVQRLPE